MQAVPNRPQKADPATSNSDTLAYSAVTVYLIHIDWEEEWWQHTPLLESTTTGVSRVWQAWLVPWAPL